MAKPESQDAYSSKISVLDGTNYVFWKVSMEAYCMSLGVDVWSFVLVDYIVRETPPTNENDKNVYGNNEKAKSAILFGLNQYDLVKVIQCKSTKEVCYKLQNSYKGDEKVKQAKLQAIRMRFESLRMNKEENIPEYFLRLMRQKI